PVPIPLPRTPVLATVPLGAFVIPEVTLMDAGCGVTGPSLSAQDASASARGAAAISLVPGISQFPPKHDVARPGAGRIVPHFLRFAPRPAADGERTSQAK